MAGGAGIDGGGDMTVKIVDMTMGALTGEPCAANAECQPSTGGPSPAGKCIKSAMVSGTTVTWPGGYCQSPCRPSRSPDVNTGLNNPDCPSDTAVCSPTSQTTGVCMSACQGIGDCREEYVCANTTGVRTPGCVPLTASTCDPVMDPRKQNKTCPMGQHCVSYSVDQSYGQCAPVCDPIKQNCDPPMQGMNGCIVDFDANDGTGTCINITGIMEGEACFFLNDCAAGMQCVGQKCRQYCKQVGVDPPMPACPNGQMCTDIKSSGRTINFKKDVVGICSP